MKKYDILLCLLLLFTLLLCHIPGGGEWYANAIYPTLSLLLSWLVYLLPFSLEELCVCTGLAVMLALPIFGWYKGWRKRRTLQNEARLCGWFFVWFYLGWGCNYYRDSIIQRLSLDTSTAYDEQVFRHFLQSYTDSLNAYSHLPAQSGECGETREMEEEIKQLYCSLPDSSGLCRPASHQHPKRVLFPGLYSAVGVAGYMGPFFCESQLNPHLDRSEYPSVYAHELAHLLGVSSEAEANFWAFVLCRQSVREEVRFSAYYKLLPYVMSSAQTVLDSTEYKDWYATLSPSLLQHARQRSLYWQSLRSPMLDDLQSSFYDWFLKSNNIPTGRKNYSEVIYLLLCVSGKA